MVRVVLCCGVFLAAFQLYLRTVVPSVYVGDGGELAVVPEVLTVAHPTGYPLYAQVGKLLLSLLPFGNIAYVTAVFSALSMALACGFLCATMQVMLASRLLPVVGAMLFAVSRTPWSQAVITEVYAFNAFFVSVLLYCMVRYQRKPSKRLLALTSLIYGLSFGHHMSTVLLAPAFLVALADFGHAPPGTYVTAINRRFEVIRKAFRHSPGSGLWAAGWRFAVVLVVLGLVINDLTAVYYALFPVVFLWMLSLKYDDARQGSRQVLRWLQRQSASISVVALMLVIGASVNLYQPIRSLPLNPRNAVCGLYWGPTHTLSGLIDHLNGRMFRNLMFTQTASSIEGRAQGYFFGHFVHQLTPLAVPVILIGLLLMLRRHRREFFPVVAIGFFNISFNLNYSIPDIEVFYVPTILVSAIFLTVGLRFLLEETVRVTDDLPTLTPQRAAFACLAPLVVLVSNYHANDRSRYWLAHDYGLEVLNSIRGSATLLTQGWITPYIIGYFQVAGRSRNLDDERVTMIIEGRENIFQRIVTGRLLLPEGFRLYTTVPLEVKGGREVYSTIRGIIYEIGLNEAPFPETDVDYWDFYLWRDYEIDDPGIFYDAHSRSLLAKYFYLQAEDRFAEGDVQGAIALCERAQKAAPGNKQVYNNIGAIYFKHDLYRLAEQACLQALAIDPDFQQARHNLGNIYYKLGRHDRALEMFRKGQRMGGRVEFFQPIVAQIYLEEGKYEEAAQEFRTALRIDPNNPEIMNQLAIAYLYNGDHGSALKVLEDALALDPRRAETHNNLGIYHDMQDNPRLAEDYFRQAVEYDPTIASAFNNLGRLRAVAGDFEAARNYFQSALEADPEFTTALNNLGGVYQTLGDPEQARKMWQRSLEINPDQEKIAALVEE